MVRKGANLRVIQEALGHRPHNTASRYVSLARELLMHQQLAGLAQGDVGAGDGRRAGAAVGLHDVAVHGEGALAQEVEAGDRPQRAADEPLDLVGAGAHAPQGGLAGAAGLSGAREHAVLGGNPAGAGAAQEGRQPVLRADGAEDDGLPQLDEGRALGVGQVLRGDAHLAHLVGLAAVGAKRGHGSITRGKYSTLGVVG